MSFSNIMPNRAQSLTTHLIQGTVIGVVLTGLSFLVGLQFNWITAVNWLEVFAVFLSYYATFLCVVERRANYPIGAVANGAYSLLFFQWGLYASSVVTGMLTFYLIYGWIRWGKDENTRPVTRLEWKWVPLYVLSTAAFYALTVWAVSLAGGTLAATDSVILIGTVIAQLLLDNKKIETWLVWMVVNVFAIYTYFNAGLTLAAFQYVFFLANAFYGLYMWKKSKDEAETNQANHPITFTPDRVRAELGLKPLYTEDQLGSKKANV